MLETGRIEKTVKQAGNVLFRPTHTVSNEE